MSVQEFRDHEIARLERSGWAANAPLREVLDVAGLRPPAQVVAECLDETADSGAAGAGESCLLPLRGLPQSQAAS